MLRQDTGYLNFEGNISFKVIAYHLESVHFFFKSQLNICTYVQNPYCTNSFILNA